MANVFLNETIYAKSMLYLTTNELVTAKLVNTKFKDDVSDENALTVNVKRPPRFARNDSSAQSAALAAQDIVTGSVPVTVNQYGKVHVSVGDIESVKSWNDLIKSETMKSAASTLAHQIDSFLQSKVMGFSNYVGHATTPTNNIGTPAEFAPVFTRLMNLGVPSTDLNATILFDDAEEITSELTGTNIQEVNRSALEEARVPILSKIKTYATQQCPSLTVGSRVAGSTSLINNGTLSVNYRDVKDAYYQTINIDGQTGSKTIKVGEVLTIASVYAWDARTGVALPFLQQFTVLGGTGVAVGSAPGTAITMSLTGGTEANIIITPPLIVAGTSDGTDTNANTAFATVDAAAVDEAAVTHLGVASTAQRVRAAWHKSAITMVSAKLTMPSTGVASFAHDPKTGIWIRYWRSSDFTTGAHGHRWDCMFGASNLDPLMGCRVSGT